MSKLDGQVRADRLRRAGDMKLLPKGTEPIDSWFWTTDLYADDHGYNWNFSSRAAASRDAIGNISLRDSNDAHFYTGKVVYRHVNIADVFFSWYELRDVFEDYVNLYLEGPHPSVTLDAVYEEIAADFPNWFNLKRVWEDVSERCDQGENQLGPFYSDDVWAELEANLIAITRRAGEGFPFPQKGVMDGLYGRRQFWKALSILVKTAVNAFQAERTDNPCYYYSDEARMSVVVRYTRMPGSPVWELQYADKQELFDPNTPVPEDWIGPSEEADICGEAKIPRVIMEASSVAGAAEEGIQRGDGAR